MCVKQCVTNGDYTLSVGGLFFITFIMLAGGYLKTRALRMLLPALWVLEGQTELAFFFGCFLFLALSHLCATSQTKFCFCEAETETGGVLGTETSLR